MVRCLGVAVRRRAPNSGSLSSRRAARPSTPSTATRDAANSIASGKPSSFRQISTTGGVFASVSAKSSTIAVTRSTNNCTAGKTVASAAVSLGDGGGQLSGPRWHSRSPATPSGSLLVARMLTPGTPLRTTSARLAAARCQVHHPDAVFITRDHALGDGQGGCGLANAAGPDDRYQALARKPRDE